MKPIRKNILVCYYHSDSYGSQLPIHYTNYEFSVSTVFLNISERRWNMTNEGIKLHKKIYFTYVNA